MGISLGLVGLGAFGSSFAPLFKSHPAVDRIALCDREPDRLKAWAERESFRDKFDPKDSYDSLEAICKSDVDALVIITQHFLHAPQAVQALESGKHVYSAVPVISIPDSDEILDWCDRIVRTVERTGLRYMYGETTAARPRAPSAGSSTPRASTSTTWSTACAMSRRGARARPAARSGAASRRRSTRTAASSAAPCTTRRTRPAGRSR